MLIALTGHEKLEVLDAYFQLCAVQPTTLLWRSRPTVRSLSYGRYIFELKLFSSLKLSLFQALNDLIACLERGRLSQLWSPRTNLFASLDYQFQTNVANCLKRLATSLERGKNTNDKEYMTKILNKIFPCDRPMEASEPLDLHSWTELHYAIMQTFFVVFSIWIHWWHAPYFMQLQCLSA